MMIPEVHLVNILDVGHGLFQCSKYQEKKYNRITPVIIFGWSYNTSQLNGLKTMLGSTN